MKLVDVIGGLGSIGMFASRAFVTAFAVAATLKWGPQIGFINNLGLLQQITDVPSWFTHDLTVTILGVLAALEIAATKNPDARQLLNEIDGHLKAGAAFVTYIAAAGIISQSEARVIQEITADAGPNDPWALAAALTPEAGMVIGGALFASIGVWFAARARGRLLGMFFDADPDDDTQVLGLLSWAEDVWALAGTVLVILIPPAMLVLTGLVLGLLWAMEWRARRREDRSKTPCASCGTPTYLAALGCPGCGLRRSTVHDINWLGQSKLDRVTDDRDAHAIKLTQKQRCPVCATRLKPRRVHQRCVACGHAPFGEADSARRYVAVLDRRLPMVLLITGVLSLIPAVGLIPGVILYRIKLVSPLRRYTSIGRNALLTWLIRLLYFALVWVQVFVPLVGGLVVPIMALISFRVYRRVFLMHAANRPATDPAEEEEDAGGDDDQPLSLPEA